MPYTLTLTLILYIYSFIFPICNDPIINVRNIHQEFIIDNVIGIGKVIIPYEFKCLYSGCTIEGLFACSEFEKYIVESLNLKYKPLIIKRLHSLLYCCNSQTSKLISLNELQKILYNL